MPVPQATPVDETTPAVEVRHPVARLLIVRDPTAADCAKSAVDDAVVAKNAVDVAFVVVELPDTERLPTTVRLPFTVDEAFEMKPIVVDGVRAPFTITHDEN